MKRSIFICLLVLTSTACEDFLATQDLLNKNDANFPANIADIEASLSAIYQPMATDLTGNSPFFVGVIASDEAFAGGNGPADGGVFAIDQLKRNDTNMMLNVWSAFYRGIFRANQLLENIDNVDGTSQAFLDKAKAETYFMRAWYYFNLARIFGEVPLFTTPEQVNKPRAAAAEVYGQIATDLKNAIDLFESESIQAMGPARLGRATKWAAEAYIARVYLFYTGYYQQSDLPLADGGSISQSQVVTYLEDCINNSGHQLAADFRELWPYTNEFTVEDYPYTAGQGLRWLGEEGDNFETVFATQYGNRGNWGNSYRNTEVTAFSLRGQPGNTGVFPFGSGWGIGTVNTNFLDEWRADEPGDPRIKMSVFDIDDPEEGIVNYIEGGWGQFHDTHHFNKKYTSIMAWNDKEAGTVYQTYAVPMYGTANGVWTKESQNLVRMRFADVLLMHSELTETSGGMNQVRARVGLAPVAYSLEAIQKERKHELFFEGLRYYDMMRWYREGAGTMIANSQSGVEVLTGGTPAVMNYPDFAARMQATKGLLPIPESEITLSGGEITQNPGWIGEGNL